VAVGLQARASPALLRATELLQSGVIGRVLTARLESETIAFGPQTDAADAYLNEHSNGATLITIHAGHAIDAAGALLGPLQDVRALTTTQFREVNVVGKSEPLIRQIPDHVFAQFRFEHGALAVEVAGGRGIDPRFRFEIIGEAGELVLHGGAARGFQSGRLALTLNGIDELVDEGELTALPDAAFNVGALYARLRDDINSGSRTAPDFDHATQLSRLLLDLEASASPR
jgi:predicted dehydrogenase